MTVAKAQGSRITIAECEICSQLSDVETSFSKYGWDDLSRSLPAAAWRLVPVEDTSTYDTRRHHVRRCPICGTFYQYDEWYEYLVNGSEDEQVLTRLTPTQARRFLAEQEYEALVTWMAKCLKHADASARRYAAQSLVDYHLERGDLPHVLPYLRSADLEVVKGVLLFLVRQYDDRERLGQLLPLQSALRKVANSPDTEISGRATYLLGRIQRYEEENSSDTLSRSQ